MKASQPLSDRDAVHNSTNAAPGSVDLARLQLKQPNSHAILLTLTLIPPSRNRPLLHMPYCYWKRQAMSGSDGSCLHGLVICRNFANMRWSCSCHHSELHCKKHVASSATGPTCKLWAISQRRLRHPSRLQAGLEEHHLRQTQHCWCEARPHSVGLWPQLTLASCNKMVPVSQCS